MHLAQDVFGAASLPKIEGSGGEGHFGGLSIIVPEH